MFLEKYLPRNKRVRMLVLMLADMCAVALASFLGLFVRFDLNVDKIPTEYLSAANQYLPFYIVATIVIFFCFVCMQRCGVWQELRKFFVF